MRKRFEISTEGGWGVCTRNSPIRRVYYRRTLALDRRGRPPFGHATNCISFSSVVEAKPAERENKTTKDQSGEQKGIIYAARIEIIIRAGGEARSRACHNFVRNEI